MAYVVDAPLVLARDQEGKVHHCYQGAVIPWLPEDLAEHLLGLGMVHVEGNAVADEPAAADGKPDADATKAELITWLVENAVDEDGGDYTESKLHPLNKAALWDLINAVED